MDHEHHAFGLPFPEWSERFARLEEALGYLAAALGRGGPGFEGRYYSLAGIEVRPDAADMPIVVGGTGPTRTPRLAGTFADEFNMAFMPAGDIRIRADRARAAAAAAGRDPDALLISVMGSAVVGRNEDSFRRNLRRVAAAHPLGREPDELEARMRERGLPVGTPQQAGASLAALKEAGVGRYYVQHLGPFDADLLEETFEVLGA
jgi:alkanesulfonate monooxygenase SsuD/methylene tetrahydromethanopterin reductase-like flavin-dependent oxidoreductase (luciferase family)